MVGARVCVGARVTEIFWAIMLIRTKEMYLHVLYSKMLRQRFARTHKKYAAEIKNTQCTLKTERKPHSCSS